MAPQIIPPARREVQEFAEAHGDHVAAWIRDDPANGDKLLRLAGYDPTAWRAALRGAVAAAVEEGEPIPVAMLAEVQRRSN